MLARTLRLHAGPSTLEHALGRHLSPSRTFASRHSSLTIEDRDRPSAGEASRDADSKASPAKRTKLPHRLRIQPHYKPYKTSEHLRAFLDDPKRALFGKRGGRNPDDGRAANPGFELETAEEMIKTAPRQSVNVAVWNQLLTACRDARAHNRMWDLYNDMKKRGLMPTLATYVIMLDAFPSTPSKKTQTRARSVYEASQRYVQSLLSADGLDVDSEQFVEEGKTVEPSRIVAITNAYVDLLVAQGQDAEIKEVLDAMPEQGNLAPDDVTFTILFRALRDGPLPCGLTCAQVWTRIAAAKGASADGRWRLNLDEKMLVSALQASIKGSDVDKRRSLALLSDLISNAPATGSGSNVSERTAEMVLKFCLAIGEPRKCVEFGNQFLANPSLAASLRTSHYDAILSALSKLRRTDEAMQLLRDRRPADNRGVWPFKLYIWPLLSAKVRRGDFDKLVDTFRTLTGMPCGVEMGRSIAPPANAPLPLPIVYQPDARMLTLMLEAAQESHSYGNMRKALRIAAFDDWPGLASETHDRNRSDHWQRRLQDMQKRLLQHVLEAPENRSMGRRPEEEASWQRLVEAHA